MTKEQKLNFGYIYTIVKSVISSFNVFTQKYCKTNSTYGGS